MTNSSLEEDNFNQSTYNFHIQRLADNLKLPDLPVNQTKWKKANRKFTPIKQICDDADTAIFILAELSYNYD